MYEVFSTRTGRIIAVVPTWQLADWICRRLDAAVSKYAYDYEKKRSSE